MRERERGEESCKGRCALDMVRTSNKKMRETHMWKFRPRWGRACMNTCIIIYHLRYLVWKSALGVHRPYSLGPWEKEFLWQACAVQCSLYCYCLCRCSKKDRNQGASFQNGDMVVHRHDSSVRDTAEGKIAILSLHLFRFGLQGCNKKKYIERGRGGEKQKQSKQLAVKVLQ